MACGAPLLDARGDATCPPGNGTNCDDGNLCTTDVCNATTGACSHPAVPDGLPCNDANVCTVTDTCAAGACIGSNPAISVPQPRLPMNNATVGNVHAPGTMRPKFGWEASAGAGCGTITYELQYSTDPTFATGATTVSAITTTTYQPPVDLSVSTIAPDGARVFWRVRGCTAAACTPYSQPPATGALPWHVNVGRSDHDLNGDGHADLLMHAQQGPLGDTGKVYVLFGSAAPAAPSGTIDVGNANVTLPTPPASAGDLFGGNVNDGDVNGDGYSDAIMKATLSTGRGQVFVYLGGAAFDGTQAPLSMLGESDGDEFGALGALGDHNGDGFDDVVVGAPGNDAGGPDTGRAYVYYGGGTFDVGLDRILVNTLSNDAFCKRVASIGDADGDGFADLAVSATTAGVRLYRGGSDGLSEASCIFANSVAAQTHLAKHPGDLNGDGFADVVVGHDAATDARSDVYLGAKGDAFACGSPSLTFSEAFPYFGVQSTIGDVNGDGFGDVVVGAHGDGSAGGKAYVYFGGAAPDTVSDGVLAQGSSTDSFGYSVSATDLNGDGRADVVIGQPNGGGGVNNGRVYVFLGGASTVAFDTSVDLLITDPTDGDQLGVSVASLLPQRRFCRWSGA